MPESKFIQIQIGLVVGIAGIQLGFFAIVKVVIRSTTIVFGETSTVKSVGQAFAAATIIIKTVSATIETKVTIVVIIEGILAFEFAIILPVDARLVDVVAKANDRKLFFGVEVV